MISVSKNYKLKDVKCFFRGFDFPLFLSAFLGLGTYLWTSSATPPLLCWSSSTDCMFYPSLKFCSTSIPADKLHLFCLVFNSNKRVFIIVAGSLLLMTTVASAVVTALLKLPVFQPSTMWDPAAISVMDKVQQINWTYVCFTRTSENYVLHYYVKPYTRYGPFLIGIMTGIHLKTKKKPLLRQKVRLFSSFFECVSL